MLSLSSNVFLLMLLQLTYICPSNRTGFDVQMLALRSSFYFQQDLCPGWGGVKISPTNAGSDISLSAEKQSGDVLAHSS